MFAHMRAFSDNTAEESVQGQLESQQNKQSQQLNKSHPRNPQKGNTSSELNTALPLAARINMLASTTGDTNSDAERNMAADAGESATSSAFNAVNASGTSRPAAHSQDTSDVARRNDPRTEDARSGYERKIGRGTSWRRDHDTLGEEEYTMRGRGRGGGPPYRGRGHRYRDYESRDYPYRRDYDRPPPGHPADPRGPPYPADDPYYDSRGNYPPPLYDSRRDYPPDAPARYHEDYRRGYDSRDFAPPPPVPIHSAMDSRRPYDRGPIPGRGADPSMYDRPYARSRDPRDDFRGDPRAPRDEPPRFPADLRPPGDPRFMDEGILVAGIRF